MNCHQSKMASTRDIHVGTPAAEFSLEESVTVHFHDFENLTTEIDERVLSPQFTCAGNEWILGLIPGGLFDAKEGMVSVILCNQTYEEIDAWIEISVRKNDNGVYKKAKVIEDELTFPSHFGCGWPDFQTRSEIIEKSNNILNEGTLTFVVKIDLHKKHRCQLVKPPSELTLGKNISKLFWDKSTHENTADLAFKVGDSVFHSHKLILHAQAPDMLELAEQFNVNTPMIIDGVEPNIFEMMLRHVYGHNIPSNKWKDHGKAILTASGKYGFTALKIEAEAWCVKNLNLTGENAADELLFADGIHCLDLKKAVIHFIINNCEEVLQSDSFLKLYESPVLIKEVMKEMSNAANSKKRKCDELSSYNNDDDSSKTID